MPHLDRQADASSLPRDGAHRTGALAWGVCVLGTRQEARTCQLLGS